MRIRMSLGWTVVLALCAVFLFISPQQAAAATYSSTVDTVVDGDTIHLKEPVLGTTKVRLLSVDASETNYNGQSQGPHAEEAKKTLSGMLPSGTPVTVETDVEEKDDYGRLLAHVHKGSLDVNREMVRQGHAVTYYIWPNMKYFTSYRSALLEARQNGSGIWNPSDPLEELPFEFRLRVGNRQPDKYVGHYDSKKYVAPAEYKQVPVEHRVFFFSESDAQAAGYSRDGGGTPAGDVWINEVLPDPDVRYTREFVELYNSGNSAVDLGGYVIDDITGGGSAPYVIPSGTVVPAKGYFVWEPVNYYNNDGDDVTLKAPDGTVTDSHHYSSSANDASWSRSPDGGNWSSQMDPTPTKGAANQ